MKIQKWHLQQLEKTFSTPARTLVMTWDVADGFRQCNNGTAQIVSSSNWTEGKACLRRRVRVVESTANPRGSR